MVVHFILHKFNRYIYLKVFESSQQLKFHYL